MLGKRQPTIDTDSRQGQLCNILCMASSLRFGTEVSDKLRSDCMFKLLTIDVINLVSRSCNVCSAGEFETTTRTSSSHASEEKHNFSNAKEPRSPNKSANGWTNPFQGVAAGQRSRRTFHMVNACARSS